MEIEIDQSIKIEQSHRATALAFSDDESRVILVPARVKQAAIRRLRLARLTGSRATFWLFAASVFFLIQDHLGQISRIVIDAEYQGHEDDVRLILLNFIRHRYPDFPSGNIAFRCIGKKSRAHVLALRVHQGKLSVNQGMRLEDFEELLRSK